MRSFCALASQGVAGLRSLSQCPNRRVEDWRRCFFFFFRGSFSLGSQVDPYALEFVEPSAGHDAVVPECDDYGRAAWKGSFPWTDEAGGVWPRQGGPTQLRSFSDCQTLKLRFAMICHDLQDFL